MASLERKFMAQKFVQSSNYNFVVEQAPSFVQTQDGRFEKDGFIVNRRTDNGVVLGKVTERYGVVQNADLVGSAEDAFKSSGLTDYTRKIIVAGQGERLYAVYDFQNKTQSIKGDIVGLRLTIQNSFDGSLRASFVAGMLRLVCLNGMVTIEREIGMTRKHGGNISTVFVAEALAKTLSTWTNSVGVFSRLSDVGITQVQGANIIAQLAERNVLSRKLSEGVAGIWASPSHSEDSARNLYNLYNAVTQHLTHSVEADRFELADRVSRNVLSILDKAGQDSGRLGKLMEQVAIAV